MLVAKRVVDTLAVDPHVLHQILDRRSPVTARPENLHSLMEDFIAIELFLSRHSCCLGYPLYSFWNGQSRIGPPELIENKTAVHCVTRLNLQSRLGRNSPADFARYTPERRCFMPTITTKDGTQIYYKDWGEGQPVVFSHGWPLSADAFEDQMFFLVQRGYRCIAHDRRGHGRSSQPWNGNDLDTYADDLAELTEALDLKDAIHVGHSTGGGEVVRYIGRHGARRVSKAVLIGAISPVMLKSETNPGGLPIEVFDEIRANVLSDRSKFWKDLSIPFYGFNRPGAKVSEGLRESFWLQGMMCGFPSAYFCIRSEGAHV